MAFIEREIVVQRDGRTPVILKAIKQEHLSQMPSILSDASEKIRRYVTRKFIYEEALSLTTDDPTYFHELRDSPDSAQFGIYVQPEQDSELLLVGFTGIGGIENGEGHSRTVIMNAEFLGQGIGKAANTGRTYYAFDPDGYAADHEGTALKLIHSRVDIRNKASRDAVYRQGYLCTDHTPMKGPGEPDWERHLLIQTNPHISLGEFELPRPYHDGDNWGDARMLSRNVLKYAGQGGVTIAV